MVEYSDRQPDNRISVSFTLALANGPISVFRQFNVKLVLVLNDPPAWRAARSPVEASTVRVRTAASMKRRKLKLKAKFESSLRYYSIKR